MQIVARLDYGYIMKIWNILSGGCCERRRVEYNYGL
jgi:hypothetical protein